MVRPLGGLFAVLGGIILIVQWGLYTSLWTLLGIVFGCLAIYGGSLIMRDEPVRGGTISAAMAIVAWGLYPTHPLSTLMFAAVGLMVVGGVMGLSLELMD